MRKQSIVASLFVFLLAGLILAGMHFSDRLSDDIENVNASQARDIVRSTSSFHRLNQSSGDYKVYLVTEEYTLSKINDIKNANRSKVYDFYPDLWVLRSPVFDREPGYLIKVYSGPGKEGRYYQVSYHGGVLADVSMQEAQRPIADLLEDASSPD